MPYIVQTIRLPPGNTSPIIEIREISFLKDLDHEVGSMVCKICGQLYRNESEQLLSTGAPPNRIVASVNTSVLHLV